MRISFLKELFVMPSTKQNNFGSTDFEITSVNKDVCFLQIQPLKCLLSEKKSSEVFLVF